MVATREVIEAAREYAQRFSIVAVRPDKKPFGDLVSGKNWRRHFSLEEIEARLAGPECVAIGFLGGDLNHNIVPLDFDTQNGEVWWSEQCAAVGLDPDDFPTVITPGKTKEKSRRKGKHRYVTDTRGILGNSEGRLKELGINVRGAGHAMLPPSPHPDGGNYAWVANHALDDFPDGVPPCPDFIYAAIAQPKHIEKPKINGASLSDARTTKYCMAALANVKQDLAREPSGSRNSELNNAAISLASLAHFDVFDEDMARAALKAACSDNGLIGDDGIDSFFATFDSGWAYGLAHPGEMPDPDPRYQQKSAETKTPADPILSPTLEVWDAADDAAQLPPRGWLLGNTFCRGFVSSLIAAGGVGKTALRIAQALALTSGEKLTDEHIFVRSNVLLVSLEDDKDELRRRVRAATTYHKIKPEQIEGRLFLAAPFGTGLKLATLEGRDVAIGQLGAQLEAQIEAHRIDLVILDPFVKAHAVEENSNSQIDLVATILSTIAHRHNCAIDAPHHVAKGLQADPGNSDRGRGAGAFKDAARITYTLATMTPEEAKQFNVSDKERKLLIRLDSGKINLAPPPEDTAWFKLVGVNLGNATPDYPHGDQVQTVEPWAPPDAWEGASNLILNKILDAIDRGNDQGDLYSAHNAAKERFVIPVVLEFLPAKSEEQAKKIITTWIKNGTLYYDEFTNSNRHEAKGLRVNATKRPS